MIGGQEEEKNGEKTEERKDQDEGGEMTMVVVGNMYKTESQRNREEMINELTVHMDEALLTSLSRWTN